MIDHDCSIISNNTSTTKINCGIYKAMPNIVINRINSIQLPTLFLPTGSWFSISSFHSQSVTPLFYDLFVVVTDDTYLSRTICGELSYYSRGGILQLADNSNGIILDRFLTGNRVNLPRITPLLPTQIRSLINDKHKVIYEGHYEGDFVSNMDKVVAPYSQYSVGFNQSGNLGVIDFISDQIQFGATTTPVENSGVNLVTSFGFSGSVVGTEISALSGTGNGVTEFSFGNIEMGTLGQVYTSTTELRIKDIVLSGNLSFLTQSGNIKSYIPPDILSNFVLSLPVVNKLGLIQDDPRVSYAVGGRGYTITKEVITA